jgi:purine-binding chemotaxis protein CheW
MQMSESTTASPASEISLACFEAGGRSYALDVTAVREIVRMSEITPLPNAPELIEGVVELRGRVVPVLDLGRVLGVESVVRTGDNRIVVLEHDGMRLGLCVESASDVLSLDPALLEDIPELAAQAGYDTVRAVVKRPAAPPVMVLSLENILESVYRGALSTSGDAG